MASQDDCGRQGTLGKCITPTGSRKHPLVFKCFIKKKAKSACVSLLLFILGFFFFSDYKISCFVVWGIKSCPTLCDCSPQVQSSVHGTLQARILERLPIPSPGDLPNPGIKSMSPTLTGGLFLPPAPREAPENQYLFIKEKWKHLKTLKKQISTQRQSPSNLSVFRPFLRIPCTHFPRN